MAIPSLGAKLLAELTPRLRALGVEGGGDRLEMRAMAPDLINLNQQALAAAKDRRAAVKIAELTADLAETKPAALERKLKNMSKSDARFQTGEPRLMAYDLREVARELGGRTASSGDDHIFNEGLELTANEKVRLRHNDGDEATLAPAGLDIDRKTTNIVVHARAFGHGAAGSRELVKTYAKIYYDRMEAEARGVEGKLPRPKALQAEIDRARHRDMTHWLDERVPVKHGERRFTRDKFNASVPPETVKRVQAAVEGYQASLPPEAAKKLAGYRLTDVVSVTSGTGSSGFDRYHVLLEGSKHDTPVVLQLKEQGVAALDQFVPPALEFASPATRNLVIMEILTGGLDPLRGVARLAGSANDFLVERLSPSRTGLNARTLKHFHDFKELVSFIADQDARNHARGAKFGLASPGEILASLGPREKFVPGIVDFAHQYADVIARDASDMKTALKGDPLLSKLRASRPPVGTSSAAPSGS